MGHSRSPVIAGHRLPDLTMKDFRSQPVRCPKGLCLLTASFFSNQERARRYDLLH